MGNLNIYSILHIVRINNMLVKWYTVSELASPLHMNRRKWKNNYFDIVYIDFVKSHVNLNPMKCSLILIVSLWALWDYDHTGQIERNPVKTKWWNRGSELKPVLSKDNSNNKVVSLDVMLRQVTPVHVCMARGRCQLTGALTRRCGQLCYPESSSLH